MQEFIDWTRQLLNADMAIVASFVSLALSVVITVKFAATAARRHAAEIKGITSLTVMIGLLLVLPLLTLLFSTWKSIAQVALNCLSISACCYFVCLVYFLRNFQKKQPADQP